VIEYIQILGIGIAIGLIDYLIKGVPKWKELAPIFQGESWHIIIGFMYILAIVMLAYANLNILVLIGVFGIINEDFSYWIFRFIHKRWWKLKPPFDIPVWFYYSLLILINGILIYLFVR